MALEQFLSVLRLLESGSYEGNYQRVGKAKRGLKPIGAYGIPEQYWAPWASRAGVTGADWRDPRAQDRVAAHRANEYLETYGNYEVAAAAWIGGTRSAYTILQRGYAGLSDIHNPEIREYVAKAKEAMQVAPDFGVVRRSFPAAAKKQNQRVVAQGGWVMPVAGPNQFSNGSWMPTTHNHRGRTHAAIDVYAEKGTPIVAPVSGKVLSTKFGKLGGHTARVLGDDGITYYFAHMADSAVVGAGQRILAGNHIGYVGNSGSAKNTKAHLHFSMKRGRKKINPYSFLSGSGDSSKYAANANAFDYANVGGGAPGTQQQMNDMLSTWSNSIAGGERKPGPSVMQTEPFQPGASMVDEAPSTKENQ